MRAWNVHDFIPKIHIVFAVSAEIAFISIWQKPVWVWRVLRFSVLPVSVSQIPRVPLNTLFLWYKLGSNIWSTCRTQSMRCFLMRSFIDKAENMLLIEVPNFSLYGMVGFFFLQIVELKRWELGNSYWQREQDHPFFFEGVVATLCSIWRQSLAECIIGFPESGVAEVTTKTTKICHRKNTQLRF